VEASTFEAENALQSMFRSYGDSPMMAGGKVNDGQDWSNPQIELSNHSFPSIGQRTLYITHNMDAIR